MPQNSEKKNPRIYLVLWLLINYAIELNRPGLVNLQSERKYIMKSENYPTEFSSLATL
ncbi:hypothetical protein [Thiomicrorhabdus arctica]|uniref:hypothetical protein n=1 Tax=Thiomicrorhabdus arctica TaxID=131540 RepID=UPI0003A9029B|nr:hypothetical protein [Thiomicrorhabdus arctica]